MLKNATAPPSVVEADESKKPIIGPNTMPLATVKAAVTGNEQLVQIKKTAKNIALVASCDLSNRP